MPDVSRNIWGTPKADVGEGFCIECEQFNHLGHFESCPIKLQQRWAPLEALLTSILGPGTLISVEPLTDADRKVAQA